jgi:hypothetical protein
VIIGPRTPKAPWCQCPSSSPERLNSPLAALGKVAGPLRMKRGATVRRIRLQSPRLMWRRFDPSSPPSASEKSLTDCYITISCETSAPRPQISPQTLTFERTPFGGSRNLGDHERAATILSEAGKLGERRQLDQGVDYSDQHVRLVHVSDFDPPMGCNLPGREDGS